MEDEIYKQELFKKVEDIQYALKYYINRTKELELENKILKEAYENRVNEYLKSKLNCNDKHCFIEDGHSEKCLSYETEESDESCNYCKECAAFSCKEDGLVMTKEQEESKKFVGKLVEKLDTEEIKFSNIDFHNCIYQENLETVLNMTEEQEEAIERLKMSLQPNIYGGNCALGYNKKYCFGKSDLDAIETVLNMLKEKDKEIEKLKQDFKIVDEECSRLEKKEIKKDKEIEKKDKIINLMAKAFKQDDVRTVEEIKQYFENKMDSTEQ